VSNTSPAATDPEDPVNRNVTKASIVAAVLVLSGCAGGVTRADDPVVARPVDAPATASVPTATRAPKPAVQPSATPSPMSEGDFCQAVMAQSRPAVAALKKLAKHPDGQGLSVEDFRIPRAKLHASEGRAPEHLRSYLHTQVAILDAATRQVATGRTQHVEVGDFVDAKTELILDCEMPE
jgi:hypothetical protein